MKTKKAVVDLLVGRSVKDGSQVLDYVSVMGKGMIDTIQTEVFPRIQFPTLELFLRAYQFSQEHDIEGELEKSFVADENKDSRRRRRYRRLYRIHSMLRDFAVIGQAEKSRVVIPFPNENVIGKLLMFDQKGRVWQSYTDDNQKTPPVYHNYYVVDDRCGPYYLCQAFIAFPRNLIGVFERAMECNPAQVEKDLKALSK